IVVEARWITQTKENRPSLAAAYETAPPVTTASALPLRNRSKRYADGIGAGPARRAGRQVDALQSVFGRGPGSSRIGRMRGTVKGGINLFEICAQRKAER
ncbi:MAG: hypothetical protein IPI17_15935, partial [Nitrosomonas sp.]|nr:hypothetical protein [Nitrosomonas sp.]